MDPSIFIRKDVRITAKRVAVKVTVPSGLRGMFIATNLCNSFRIIGLCNHLLLHTVNLKCFFFAKKSPFHQLLLKNENIGTMESIIQSLVF